MAYVFVSTSNSHYFFAFTNKLHPGSIWGQTMPGKLLVALRLPLEKSYHLLHLVHVFR
jgi:hypothetical protein